MDSEIPSHKLYLIFYCIIMRRLGVRCDLREPHNKLFIYWKPRWDVDENSINNIIYNINPMTGFKTISRGCPFRGPDTPLVEKPYSPVSLLHTLASTERSNDDTVMLSKYVSTLIQNHRWPSAFKHFTLN